MSEHAMQAPRLREIDDLLAECQRHGMPGIMVSYAQLRALRAEIERLASALEVQTQLLAGANAQLNAMRADRYKMLEGMEAIGWPCRLVELPEEYAALARLHVAAKEEIDRLTADRDRYKAWCDDVASRRIHVLQENGRVYDAIVRPQPMKENE